MNQLVNLVPAADRAILESEFQRHQEKLPSHTTEKFIENIVWRVYTELCCSSQGARIRSPYPHAGDGLKRWVDQEIHFALEGKQIDDAKYAEMRQAIIRGVAARAAELFAEWKGKTYPEDKNDTRNLRASLRQYLPPHFQYEMRPAGNPTPEGNAPVLEQQQDGSTMLHWSSPDTVMVARGTKENPLPDLLLTDPQRAADLLFGLPPQQ